MNRRHFIAALSALALTPPIAISAPAPQTYRDPNDVLSVEDIERHFIPMDKPVVRVPELNHIIVARTYFTKSATWRDTFLNPDGSVNERERARLKGEVIQHINRWMDGYRHMYRGFAELEGPFVYSAYVPTGCWIIDCNGRHKVPVMMRVAKCVGRLHPTVKVCKL